MRRLTSAIAIALLALASLSFNSNAARRACACPTLAVSCSDAVPTGKSTTFRVAVSNFSRDAKFSYTWTVSAGTILSGQGTPAIIVDTTGLHNQSAEATVEVGGLPDSCERKSSCTTAVTGLLIGDAVDQYGNIPFEDEKARLDNFAIELLNDPTSQGYLICYGGKVGFAGEAWARCKRAKNYIANVRGIASSRLVTLNGGYKEDLSAELWVVPAGAKPPTPSPTVDPKDVQFIKGGAKGRRRH
jgi:hypothetical protein